jgi:beta-glucanase (GH16 family)
MFPALWMYRSVDVNHHADAEFDLMEIFGNDGQPWSTTIHGNGQRISTDGDRGYNTNTSDWHRYGVDWQPGYVAFYRDGAEYARKTDITGWLNSLQDGKPAKMGIRMDYAVNPNWGGPPQSNNNTPNPLYMEIDYVRAYKAKPDLPAGTGDPYAN